MCNQDNPNDPHYWDNPNNHFYAGEESYIQCPRTLLREGSIPSIPESALYELACYSLVGDGAISHPSRIPYPVSCLQEGTIRERLLHYYTMFPNVPRLSMDVVAWRCGIEDMDSLTSTVENLLKEGVLVKLTCGKDFGYVSRLALDEDYVVVVEEEETP